MRRPVNAAAVVLVALFATPPLSADPNKSDASLDPKSFLFLTDGKGHFIAAEPDQRRFYYARGDGPFEKQPIVNYTTGPEQSFWDFWSPEPPITGKANRSMNVSNGDLRLRGGKWAVRCGPRVTPLVAVDAKTAANLRRRPFRGPHHRRTAYLFGRDDDGVYYLVDEIDGTDRRLFVGKSGAVKQVRLTSVIVDDVGDIFEGADGKLVRNRVDNLFEWRPRTGPTRKVYALGSRRNEHLLFGSLGVYRGRLGTPCDDL